MLVPLRTWQSSSIAAVCRGAGSGSSRMRRMSWSGMMSPESGECGADQGVALAQPDFRCGYRPRRPRHVPVSLQVPLRHAWVTDSPIDRQTVADNHRDIAGPTPRGRRARAHSARGRAQSGLLCLRKVLAALAFGAVASLPAPTLGRVAGHLLFPHTRCGGRMPRSSWGCPNKTYFQA